jgi:hypothetical protein
MANFKKISVLVLEISVRTFLPMFLIQQIVLPAFLLIPQPHNENILSLQLRRNVAIASFYSAIDYYASLPHPTLKMVFVSSNPTKTSISILLTMTTILGL